MVHVKTESDLEQENLLNTKLKSLQTKKHWQKNG
jgi:hypothetical protein